MVDNKVGPLEQRLVVYDGPRQKRIAFTTVYTEDQARDATDQCVRRHGINCNPHTVSADAHAQKARKF